MRLNQKRVAILLCSAAVTLMGNPAFAKHIHHRHHHHHHHHHASAYVTPRLAASQASDSDRVPDQRYAMFAVNAKAAAPVKARRSRRRASVAAMTAQASVGGFTTSSLVAEARKYIGTNPTGRGRLWCGAFMDMVLRHTGHAGGGNLALAYEHYGRRVSGPRVGAIAVMGRHGGGHVGMVSGIDANGNPIIVSGNHNRIVAESVYPRGRIAAYVVPGN